MDEIARLERQADFEFNKESLERFVEQRKKLKLARDSVQTQASRVSHADTSESEGGVDDTRDKSVSVSAPSQVWMSSKNSSFFLMDSETEAKPMVEKKLEEVEEDIRDVCAKLQEDMDSMHTDKNN
jgi:hypothetical protein